MKQANLNEESPVMKNDLNGLSIETMETLASNVPQDLFTGKAKHFSVADMWKIQRRKRSASDMRRRLK